MIGRNNSIIVHATLLFTLINLVIFSQPERLDAAFLCQLHTKHCYRVLTAAVCIS